MLILNNTSLPVNNEPETYASIMATWVATLEAMNNPRERHSPESTQRSSFTCDFILALVS